MNDGVTVVVAEGYCCDIKQLVPRKCFPVAPIFPPYRQGRQRTDVWPFSNHSLVEAAFFSFHRPNLSLKRPGCRSKYIPPPVSAV